MQDSIKHSCLVFFLLGLCWLSPTFAETQQPHLTTQEPDEKAVPSSKPGDKKLPQKPIPFAQYEKALKNSEKWKTLSPEEQKEALDKIEQFRKRFRQRQAELQKKYKPLLEKKPTKRSSLLRRNREVTEQTFDDVWGRWQALMPNRQKELSKKWKIPKTIPSKTRQALLKVWKKLMPATRQQFLRDLG